MELPISKQVNGMIYPATYDPFAGAWGCGFDHYLFDPRGWDDRPDDPPRSWEHVWQVKDMEYLWKMRGAHLRSYKRRRSVRDLFVPADYSTLMPTPNGWYDPENKEETTGPWQIVHPPAYRGADFGAHPIATESVALVSTPKAPRNLHFLLTWSMSAPPEDYDAPQWIEVGLGMAEHGEEPQWVIGIPRPSRPRANQQIESDYPWAKFAYILHEGELVDTFRNMGRGYVTDVNTGGQWSNMQVQHLDGKFVISLAGTGDVWVYGGKDPVEVDEGHIFIGGCGGELCIGWEDIHYVTEGNAQSKPVYRPAWINFTGEAKVQYWVDAPTIYPGLEPQPIGSVQADYVEVNPSARICRMDLTVTTDDSHQTPIVYSVQEIHRTDLQEGWGEGFDISRDIEELSIDWGQERRGAEATIELRNWREKDDLTGYDVGIYDAITGGEHIRLRARHIYPSTPNDDAEEDEEENGNGNNGDNEDNGNNGDDDGWVDLFDGIVLSRTCNRSADLKRNTVSISVGDRAYLWLDGRATMIFTPALGGWDFKEAMELVFTQWEVPVDDIIFPNDYDENPIAIPRIHPQYSSFLFEATTEMIEAVDIICRAVGYTWHINGKGNVVFERTQLTGTAPTVFELNEDTVTPLDIITRVDATKSIEASRNTVYLRAQNEDGEWEDAVTTYPPARNDPNSPYYVGRWLWLVEEDRDVGNPSLAAQTLLYEHLPSVSDISWKTIARDLWPGDIVEVNVTHLGIDAGTRFRIVSKRTSIVSMTAQQDPVWMDDYEAELVKPWEMVPEVPEEEPDEP